MESKKEIRIKLSTAVVMVIITIFLIVLGFICYVKITKNNNKYVQETYSSNSLQEGEKYNSIENKSEEENIIEQGKMENKKITQSEAKEILSTQYNKLAKLHTENQFKYSSSEMEKNFKAKITNYNSIINNIFTENGKEIYEKEMNEFITIENGDAYIHAGDDNSGEVYAGFDIENIKIESESSIKCTIIKKMDYSMMSDEKTEIVKVKSDFIVNKVNGKWLIDEFEWMEDDSENAKTTSSNNKKNAKYDVEISMAKLEDLDYSNDKQLETFENKYKGKTVKITGYVSSFGKSDIDPRNSLCKYRK